MPGLEGSRVVGLYLGAEGVPSAVSSDSRVPATRFVPPMASDGATEDLGASLAAVLEALEPDGRRRLRIVLTPSLAPGRVVAAEHARAPVSERRARPEEGEPVLSFSPVRGGADAYLALCPTAFLEDLARALTDAGCVADAVTPADFAWAAATSEAARTNGSGLCVLQLTGPHPETRILGVSDAKPVALRRLPPESDVESVADVLRDLAGRVAEVEQEVPVLALGDPAFRDRIHAAATTAGLELLNPEGLLADLDFDPGFVAAAFAGAGPRFVPPQVVTAALGRRRRWTIGAVAASVVLLGASALLRTADLSRELEAVRAARTDVRTQVNAGILASNEAKALREALTTLLTSETARPRWSSMIGDLSEALPMGTYATAVRTTADSLFVEMEGDDAAVAFEELRGMPGLSGFRAAAPVRREVDEESRLVERFTAAATVSWPRGRQDGGGPP